MLEHADVQRHPNAGEEEGHEKFGNALREIMHAAGDRIRKRDPGQESADDGGDAGVGSKDGQREE